MNKYSQTIETKSSVNQLLRLHVSLLSYAVRFVREVPKDNKHRAKLLNLLSLCQPRDICDFNIMHHFKPDISAELEPKSDGSYYIHFEDLGTIIINEQTITFLIEPSWLRNSLMHSIGRVTPAISQKPVTTTYIRTEDLPTRCRRLLKILQCDMVRVTDTVGVTTDPELAGVKQFSVQSLDGSLRVQEIRRTKSVTVSRAIDMLDVNLIEPFDKSIYKTGVPLDVSFNAFSGKDPIPATAL